jgi:tetratricopeptide (TPR) repeat protein
VTGPPSLEEPRVHDDRCAQRIRVLRLAEAGDPLSPPIEMFHAIAAEIQSCCGQIPLRAFRLAYGWTVAGAIKALHSRPSARADHAGMSKRAWQDWETGKRPNRHNQDLLCRLFGTGPVELGFASDYGERDGGAVSADAGRTARSPAVTRHGLTEPMLACSPSTTLPGSGLPTQSAWSGHEGVEWDLVMDAAHESSEHAAAFESASVGPNALEQIAEDAFRLARAYLQAPPQSLLGELIRVRDRAYWLLDRTRNPSQQRDLYLIAGQACGLLSSASFDLGYPRAAAQQARAARSYGEIIDGKELTAWADGMLAVIDMWAGRPRQALLVIERGLSTAPDGTCQVRLWCIAARAAAIQGDEERAVKAIVASKRVRDSRATPTELHDSVSGEFGFGPARQAFSNGSAYLKLSRSAEALAECGQALELYAQAAAEDRWYAAEAGTRADMATAHLMRGDLSGAREAVSAVLSLDSGMRVEGVIHRLNGLREVLAGSGFQHGAAQSFADEIEEFTAAPAIQALPAPPI